MIILPTIFIVAFLLSRPVEFCQCILLDIHIPLGGGCVRDYALLANRLLRGVASSSGSNEDGNEEMVHLDTIHVPHVTLYLADFDLEVNDEEAEEAEELTEQQQQTSRRSLSHHDDDWNSHTAPTATQRPLNQTKVDMFLHAISSINFNDIITRSTNPSIEGGGRGGCHLSLISSSMGTPPSSISSSALSSREYLHYYTINGNYIMLLINKTSCLSTLSNTLLMKLKQYVHHPVLVPSWVANLPEPERSAAIYRARTYGSSNVLEGFVPHVTVGFEPSSIPHDVVGSRRRRQWRMDVMERWNYIYLNRSIIISNGTIGQQCTDDIVTAIALGKSSVGGTVVANSNLGYWPLFNETRTRIE